MSAPDDTARLSRLSTHWSDLGLAHDGPPADRREALARLVDRYRPAAVAYLRAMTRDPQAADELFQRFALKLAAGGFRDASPERGRFRHYLRSALRRLALDHHREADRAGPAPLSFDPPDPAPGPGDDRAFRAFWRAELIDRGWAALERVEREFGQPLATLLRLRLETPGSSDRLAEAFAPRWGRPVGGPWVRERLRRARAVFADAVVAGVAETLHPPTADGVAEELAELGLLDRCRAAWERWAAGRRTVTP
ncbi:MAG: hypothetical protein K2X87_29790 [Gemmataceae bacterium]|nr:hypothetical protein [Gemmataceae bacterium]